MLILIKCHLNILFRLIVDEGHEIFGLQLTNASVARYTVRVNQIAYSVRL